MKLVIPRLKLFKVPSAWKFMNLNLWAWTCVYSYFDFHYFNLWALFLLRFLLFLSMGVVSITIYIIFIYGRCFYYDFPYFYLWALFLLRFTLFLSTEVVSITIYIIFYLWTLFLLRFPLFSSMGVVSITFYIIFI